MKKIYKVWYAWKGIASWSDCRIKYVRCSRIPTEAELLALTLKNTGGLFPAEYYVWKVEVYKPEKPEIIDLDTP